MVIPAGKVVMVVVLLKEERVKIILVMEVIMVNGVKVIILLSSNCKSSITFVKLEKELGVVIMVKVMW